MKRNLTINQGSRFIFPINVVEDGVTKDLTGCTARMQVRKAKTDTGAPLADLTTENGSISINAPAGRVTINLTSIQTGAYAWTHGFYDLELVYAGGESDRLLEGVAYVSPQVTR